jgi:hypothetical protein
MMPFSSPPFAICCTTEGPPSGGCHSHISTKLRRWYMVGMSVAELKPVLQTSSFFFVASAIAPYWTSSTAARRSAPSCSSVIFFMIS